MKKIIILGLLGLLACTCVVNAQKVERKIIGSGETLRIGSGKGGISSTVRGGVGSAVQGPSDVIITFEGGSNGDVLGTNLIHSFTTGLSFGSSVGVFIIFSNSISVTGAITSTISTVQAARGTRSYRVAAGIDNHYVQFLLGTSNNVMSAGFAYFMDAGWTGATFNSYNWFEYHSSDGAEFTVANFFDNPGAEFAIQTSLGLSTPYNPWQGTWMWITLRWNGIGGGDGGTISFYDYAGSGVLGTFRGSSNLGFTTTPKYPQRFVFGRTDNHDVFNPGAFVYIDDVVIRYDGAFPVLPP